MKLFNRVYLTIGILLLATVLVCAMTGLPEQDRKLVDQALSLEDRMERDGWPGLRIGEYPLAIRKGAYEFVISGREITKRKPVLPVIACTAYKAGNEINVFLLCKSEMDQVGQIAEGLSSDMQNFFLNRFSMNTGMLSNNRYVALLFHEAMHAYQLKYHEDKLQGLQSDMENSEIEAMLAELESDPELSSLYDRQFHILTTIVDLGKETIDKGSLTELIQIRHEMEKCFEEKAGIQNAARIAKFINYTELSEGTARYIEWKAAEALSDRGLQRVYFSSLQEKAKGKEKYYRSGMALCALLDKIRPGWKEIAFSGDLPLAGLLERISEEKQNG